MTAMYSPSANRKRYFSNICLLLSLLSFLTLFIFQSSFTAAASEDPFFYSIQLGSFKVKANAEKYFDTVENKLSGTLTDDSPKEKILDFLRIEHIDPFYTIRTGKFTDRQNALLAVNNVRTLFPNAALINAYIKSERIVRIRSTAESSSPESHKEEPENTKTAPQTAIATEAVKNVFKEETPPEIKTPGIDTVKHLPATEPVSEPAEDSSSRLPDEPREQSHVSVQKPSIVVPEADVPALKRQKAWGGSKVIFLALVIIVIFIAIKMLRGKKNPITDLLKTASMEHTGMQNNPKLTESMETEIVHNHRELSMFEGNILESDTTTRTIYVTSCHNGEGKTTAAVSMAYSLATNKNANVLLIDGGVNPKVHDLFDIQQTPGLTDTIADTGKLDESLVVTEYQNLTTMPSGTALGSYPRYNPDQFQSILGLLKERFDYIIFDGHPLIGSSQAQKLAQMFDGIAMVVECEKTKWEVVQVSLEKLRKTRANILGIVLNKRKYYIPKFLYGRI